VGILKHRFQYPNDHGENGKNQNCPNTSFTPSEQSVSLLASLPHQLRDATYGWCQIEDFVQKLSKGCQPDLVTIVVTIVNQALKGMTFASMLLDVVRLLTLDQT